MKKAVILMVLMVLIVSFGIYLVFYLSGEESVMKEGFTYYPKDRHSRFVAYQTSLKWIKQTGEDRYSLRWHVSSTLNQPSFLRQDISLLYEDGRLIQKMTERKEEAKKIWVEKKINRENSGHFQAITVHYAELHYPNGQIASRRQMSYDQLYVTASPLSHMDQFEVPETKAEREWKHILNHAVDQQLDYSWDDLIKDYHIQAKQYYRFPLPYLYVYSHNRLPGLTKKETEQAIGKLWDLLYKHYFIGIQLKKGKTVSPIGSTVPLVLFAKNGSRFVVIAKTKDGQNMKLVEPLAPDANPS